MIKNYFLTTIHTLRQNPLYTALSVFGIALTFVFVCLLFLIVKHSKGDFIPSKYAERTWEVYQLTDQKNRYHAINRNLSEALVSQMKTPEVTVVTSNEMDGQIIIGNIIAWPNIQCIDTNYYKVCRFEFLYGRPINRQEIIDAAPVAVIDRYLTNLRFGRGENPVGQSLELEGMTFRIVGVVEDISSLGSRLSQANAWISITALKDQNFKRAIAFTAKDEASVAEMKAEFTRILATMTTTDGVQYRVPGWRQNTIKQSEMLGPIFSLLGCLILILIPALNILSLNVSKSYDRTEEIAIRKTFGAPLSAIFGQLFLENLMVTFIGAIIGMCATPLILNAIDSILLNASLFPMSLSLRFDWITVLLVAGPCVLLFSFFSGSIPAWITAKQEIVNVLKGEAQ